MQRSVHIIVILLMVFLLVKPFDCFGSGQVTPKTADCCKKGKCVPSSNSDDCCKGMLPGGKQLIRCKAPHQPSVAPQLAPAVLQVTIAPVSTLASVTESPAPPGSPPRSRINLPLLV